MNDSLGSESTALELSGSNHLSDGTLKDEGFKVLLATPEGGCKPSMTHNMMMMVVVGEGSGCRLNRKCRKAKRPLAAAREVANMH